MMDQRQLELEFDAEVGAVVGAHVVEFGTFFEAREARARRKAVLAQAQLIDEIVKSVEHITGRSPEAEAL